MLVISDVENKLNIKFNEMVVIVELVIRSIRLKCTQWHFRFSVA